MHPQTSLPQNSYWQLLWRFTKLTTGVGVFVFVIAQYAYGMSLRNPWQNTQYVTAKAASVGLYLGWTVVNNTNSARADTTTGAGAVVINVSSTVVTNVSRVATNVSILTTNGSTIVTNVSTVATNVSSAATNVSGVLATNSSSTVVTNVSGEIETGGHNELPRPGSSETQIVACPLIPANLSKYQ